MAIVNCMQIPGCDRFTRLYKGLAKDYPNLPKNTSTALEVQTGSIFKALDTNQEYEFERESNTWHIQQ